ncbi:MAG: 2-hydroxychromene-2-carboxylate isomerase [Pelagibacteraceae bacterium TMED232]|nr:MAG: 2-hydroxychromene-2-carboxylate isomerase [Pelagibacteraceae bacterium TMED232]|tara:strand:- start:2283 stop:2867 length:585 start_codon:yes stop_codon:yes gene_type:complete
MTKNIDFYFDFISPYSYLAYKKLKRINNTNQIKVEYKPILLGGLHKLSEITPPAFNERKLKNMKNDCELVAIKNDIEFEWNSKFPLNSLYLMRGYLVVEKNLKNKFFEVCFDAYWRDNMDILDEKNLDQILTTIGLDKNSFLQNIENQEVKDMLKKLTNDAFEKDIFGAPSFVVNNKIFWGQDRLAYALDEYNS